MIFYSTTEAELFDFSITERGLSDIKTTGFDSIYLEYRNMKADCSSPRFQEWLSAFCRLCEEADMKLVIDTHMRAMNQHFRQEKPEVYSDALKYAYFNLQDGKFELSTTGEVLHWDIEKAYLIERVSGEQLKACRDVTAQVRSGRVHMEGGGCAMTETTGQSVALREFSVEGVNEGELMLVSRHRYLYVDFDYGHPSLMDSVPDLFDMFGGEGRPCEGFMWDEPHFGFAFYPDQGRAISERLYAEFEAQFGYDLRGRLVELWWDVEGSDSAQVRLHYAELLETQLSKTEERYCDEAQVYAKSQGKERISYMGMHRTMHGELADDFYIGCADYFRHNRFTNHGFTDSVFERDDSMFTFFRFAQSLALDSRDGEAWSNNWGFKPTEAHHHYYFPLMGIMNIRWIGHTYHNSILFGPGYPDSDLWPTMPEHLKDHGALIDALAGAKVVADTAVLYNWKAMARYPSKYIHTHRRNLLLMSKQFAQQGTQFLFIDDEILAGAEIEGDDFVTRIGSFSRLIVPWADMLLPEAFVMLQKLAAAGVEILIFGTPAERTSDGACVKADFASLIGVEVQSALCIQFGDTIELEGASFTMAPEQVQENFSSNPAETYPDHYKRYQILVNGVEAAICRKGSVAYSGAELPFYPGALAQLVSGFSGSLPERGIAMLHADTLGEFVGICGEYGEPMQGALEWGGQSIDLSGQRYALVRRSEDGLEIILKA